jgi:hypothetical protein
MKRRDLLDTVLVSAFFVVTVACLAVVLMGAYHFTAWLWN